MSGPKTTDREFLRKLAATLDAWPRLRLAAEGPEGELIVRLSDKLLRELTAELRCIADRMAEEVPNDWN
jgi:hypothetical protein